MFTSDDASRYAMDPWLHSTIDDCPSNERDDYGSDLNVRCQKVLASMISSIP